VAAPILLREQGGEGRSSPAGAGDVQGSEGGENEDRGARIRAETGPRARSTGDGRPVLMRQAKKEV